MPLSGFLESEIGPGYLWLGCTAGALVVALGVRTVLVFLQRLREEGRPAAGSSGALSAVATQLHQLRDQSTMQFTAHLVKLLKYQASRGR